MVHNKSSFLIFLIISLLTFGMSISVLADGDGGSDGDAGAGDGGSDGDAGAGDGGSDGDAGAGDGGSDEDAGAISPSPSPQPPVPPPQPSTPPSGPTPPGTGGAGDGGGGDNQQPLQPPVVIVQNNAPTLNIPDQTVNEDAGSLNNLVDLFTHAADDITAVASLIFSIVSQSASNIISCSLDSNRFIDCITQSDQNGFSDVAVSVTDGSGATTFDTFRITVLSVDDPVTVAASEEDEDFEARERVYIGAISFDKDFVKPGDELLVYVSFQNKGTEDLKDVRLTAIIQDLGIRSPAVKAEEVDDGDKESKTLILEIPENAKPGRYDVEVVVDIDGKRRVKFRPIDVI